MLTSCNFCQVIATERKLYHIHLYEEFVTHCEMAFKEIGPITINVPKHKRFFGNSTTTKVPATKVYCSPCQVFTVKTKHEIYLGTNQHKQINVNVFKRKYIHIYNIFKKRWSKKETVSNLLDNRKIFRWCPKVYTQAYSNQIGWIQLCKIRYEAFL